MAKDINTFATILAWIGCTLTSIRLIPQVYKVIKTRETSAISLPMLFVTIASTSVWICYAILKKEPAIIATNSFILIFAFIIVMYKLYNIWHKGEK